MRYQSYENPMTLLDILASIMRYKVRVALVALLMFGLVVLGIAVYPKRYQSEAKLFVRLGRGSASLDPAAIGQTIAIQESRETEMNSITDMLKSRSLAEAVVSEIGVERLLKKVGWLEKNVEYAADTVSACFAPLTSFADSASGEDGSPTPEEIDTKKRFELATKDVSSNLKIDLPKKATTIGLAYRARDPELAKEIISAVIKNYRKMHLAAYKSHGAFEFFDEQFSQQEALVKASENELRKAKNEHGVVTMQGKQNQLQSEITDVKKMQIITEADLHATHARVANLEIALGGLDEQIVSQKTSGIASSATDSIRSRLFELEIQEKEYAAKFVSTDPRLQRVRDQIRSARAIFDEQPDERPQSVMAVNPVRQKIENELLVARSNVAGLEAKAKALKRSEEELLTRLADVNDLEVVSEDLQRKIVIARNNHRSYALKLEESRINRALDEQALSNVSVVGAPTTQYKHVTPKRSLLAAVGVCFSMFCGVLVALVSDYSRNTREMSVIRKAERAAYLRQLESAQDTIGNPNLAADEQRSSPERTLLSVNAGQETEMAVATADHQPDASAVGENVDDTPKKAK